MRPAASAGKAAPSLPARPRGHGTAPRSSRRQAPCCALAPVPAQVSRSQCARWPPTPRELPSLPHFGPEGVSEASESKTFPAFNSIVTHFTGEETGWRDALSILIQVKAAINGGWFALRWKPLSGELTHVQRRSGLICVASIHLMDTSRRGNTRGPFTRSIVHPGNVAPESGPGTTWLCPSQSCPPRCLFNDTPALSPSDPVITQLPQ